MERLRTRTLAAVEMLSGSIWLKKREAVNGDEVKEGRLKFIKD